MTRDPITLTVTDAVLIMALVYFMDERAFYREDVTVKAATKIAGLVNALNQDTAKPLAELGVYVRRGIVKHVPEEVLVQACRLLLKHQAQEQARTVVAHCRGKSVAQVEQLNVRALTRRKR